MLCLACPATIMLAINGAMLMFWDIECYNILVLQFKFVVTHLFEGHGSFQDFWRCCVFKTCSIVVSTITHISEVILTTEEVITATLKVILENTKMI